jgi:hypothetical protein
MPREKRATHHYVNNKEFTQAVIDWCKEVNDARGKGDEGPPLTNYISTCIFKLADGLSHKAQFIGYPFREDMVMDAVENMLRVLDKATFSEYAETRSGTPNAFGYFTQSAWYAFIRRIQKEKKEYHTKLKYIAEASLDDFMVDADEDPEVARVVRSFLENLRGKIDDMKHKEVKSEPKRETKKMSNRRKGHDSDLTEMFK